MEWFVEKYDGAAMMIKVKSVVFELRGIQHIQIFETESFGKMLVLDGKIQLTERDEAFYHEMLVHPVMMSHRDPRKVLIVGGGDGGAAREVLKHDPSEVVLVEIDENVVNACREYLGIDRGALSDERVSVVNEDGLEFVRDLKERFDVIIVDGTDPGPVSSSITSKDFYEACSRRSDFFSTQSQSPFAQREYFELVVRNASVFREKRVYLGYVPTYPMGMWSYIMASSRERIPTDIEVIRGRFLEREIETVYYTPELHISSLCLPKWVSDIVRSIWGVEHDRHNQEG